MKFSLTIASTCFALLPLVPANAAVIANLTNDGLVNAASPAIDLSAAGTTNWAAWDVSNSSIVTSLAATSSKKNGIGTFSSITGVTATGTNNVRSTTSSTAANFTWTTADEAGNANAGANNKINGVFNENLNTPNNGVTLSLTGLAALTAGLSYEVNVYTAVFQGAGLLSVNVNGGTASTVLGSGQSTSKKETAVYSFNYNPDSTMDALNITYLLDSGGDANSYAMIQAVAVRVVPEPSGFAMLTGGLALASFRRRRA